MLFKRFDVTLNTVLIDDDVIERPSYISVGDWQSFWGNALDAADGEGWNEGYDEGYKEGLNAADDEHRADIAHLESEHEREISRLESQIEETESEAYERGRRDGIIEGRLDSSL